MELQPGQAQSQSWRPDKSGIGATISEAGVFSTIGDLTSTVTTATGGGYTASGSGATITDAWIPSTNGTTAIDGASTLSRMWVEAHDLLAIISADIAVTTTA